jgi:hypothetical protein
VKREIGNVIGVITTLQTSENISKVLGYAFDEEEEVDGDIQGKLLIISGILKHNSSSLKIHMNKVEKIAENNIGSKTVNVQISSLIVYNELLMIDLKSSTLDKLMKLLNYEIPTAVKMQVIQIITNLVVKYSAKKEFLIFYDQLVVNIKVNDLKKKIQHLIYILFDLENGDTLLETYLGDLTDKSEIKKVKELVEKIKSVFEEELDDQEYKNIFN